MKTLVIARRELAGYLLSPVSYLVVGLFLAVQGYSFWLFLELLNGRETPHGAVLQYFFGGTFLYWLFVMFLVAILTMRLVAEERARGTLELLLTTPVHDAQVVVGKYLGALGFWVALWTPTLLYVAVLAAFAPPGAPPDPGPIAAGYLGTLLVGAGALAVGLLFSALTRSQVLAAMLTFVTLVLLLLVGALGDLLLRSGPLAPLLQHINLFRHMEDFGRGIVDSRRVVWHLGLVALGLFGAARAVEAKRAAEPGRLSGRNALELGLLLMVIAGGNVLGARHYLRGDWTRGQTFALSDKTTAVLRALPVPVQVTVFMVPTGAEAHDLYGDVRELLERARRVAPRLAVEYVDIDRDPERLRLVGKQHGVTGDDLLSGVIVLTAGDQSKFITRDELAEYDWSRIDEGRGPRLKAWKGEQALLGALAQVTEERARVVCFTEGHGEPATDSFQPSAFGELAEALRRDHLQVRGLELGRGVPDSCDLVVLGGPQEPIPPLEVAALQAWLEGGGRLWALLGPRFDRELQRFVSLGLDELLGRWGAELGDALVVDPARLGGSPLAFVVSDGYLDHPITARFVGRRTVWPLVRPVRALDRPGIEARELVRSSEEGWGELDLGLLRGQGGPSFDPASDMKGPLSLAVAAERKEGTGKGARLVVMGSSALAENGQVGGDNRDLLLGTAAWLLGSGPKLAIGPRSPEHLRLRLDDRQLERAFLLCVLGLPLLVLGLGGAVFWRRRR